MDIVSAGMADAVHRGGIRKTRFFRHGQGVYVLPDRNGFPWSSSLQETDHAGLQADLHDLDPVFLQLFPDQGCRPVLFVAQLRICMDMSSDSDHIRLVLFYKFHYISHIFLLFSYKFIIMKIL